MNDNPKIIKNASKVNASCSDTFYFPMTVLNKLDQIAREKGVTTEQLIIQFVEKGLNQEFKGEKNKMKKYLINQDDTVRVGQSIYKIDPNSPETSFLVHTTALKDYENRLIKNGVDAEIFHAGNDQNTTALMQGDIIASKQEPRIAFILISNQLMPLHEAKYALDAYSENRNPNVISLPSPSPSPQMKQEFDKRDKKMSHDIDELKKAVNVAESQGVVTIDGVTYDASHIWRDVAQMALDLADQQEWFNRYDAKYCN